VIDGSPGVLTGYKRMDLGYKQKNKIKQQFMRFNCFQHNFSSKK